MPVFVRASSRAKAYVRKARPHSTLRVAKSLRIALTTQKNYVKRHGAGYLGMGNAKTASIAGALYHAKAAVKTKRLFRKSVYK